MLKDYPPDLIVLVSSLVDFFCWLFNFFDSMMDIWETYTKTVLLMVSVRDMMVFFCSIVNIVTEEVSWTICVEISTICTSSRFAALSFVTWSAGGTSTEPLVYLRNISKKFKIGSVIFRITNCRIYSISGQFWIFCQKSKWLEMVFNLQLCNFGNFRYWFTSQFLPFLMVFTNQEFLQIMKQTFLTILFKIWDFQKKIYYCLLI